jgi:hypothetical protein
MSAELWDGTGRPISSVVFMHAAYIVSCLYDVLCIFTYF